MKKVKNVLKLMLFWRSEREGRERESNFQTGHRQISMKLGEVLVAFETF